MPYKKSKYTKLQNSEMEFRVIHVLAESAEALTIDEIKCRDIGLVGITSQKMARVLGGLVDMGFAIKSKHKTKNRMVYKAIGVMEEQGYDMDNVVC
jgi:hypothetical protein